MDSKLIDRIWTACLWGVGIAIGLIAAAAAGIGWLVGRR